MNRSELINNYAYQIMEGMDMKTMECFVMDCLTDNLNSYTDEELIAEVTEYNPELLEECDSWPSVHRGLTLPPIHPILTSVQTNASHMRKIERQMNTAISNNENWQSANTRVEFDFETGESKVYLHGNHIADVGDDYIRLFDGGWQSNTTKSRLNAIMAEHGIPGEGVFQHKFEWFVRLYNGTEFFTTEFRNGMRLGALATSDLLVWLVNCYLFPSLPVGLEYQPLRKKGYFIMYQLIKYVVKSVK